MAKVLLEKFQTGKWRTTLTKDEGLGILVADLSAAESVPKREVKAKA